jgi:hypothetical protein
VNEFGLDASWQSETNKFAPVNETKEVDEKEQNRRDWIALQKQYPNTTKTELRKLSPALYARLYRGDRTWLNDNSPSLQQPSVSVNKRVDWEKRDQEVKIQVEKAVQEILQQDKPERVTLRKVGVITGLKALLEHKLDKLPLTKTYLEEAIESVEMFQDRRIKWAIELLEQKGEEVKAWKIMRIAGLKNNCLERVENIVY